MLTAYMTDAHARVVDAEHALALDKPMPEHAVWLDLEGPSAAEIDLVQRWTGQTLPTPEDMAEIEVSSRLYEEEGALVLTATVIHGADTTEAGSAPLSFLVTPSVVATIRYVSPRPFQTLPQHCVRHPRLLATSESALVTILDAVIDRLADVLEIVQADLDQLSAELFTEAAPSAASRQERRREQQYQALLRRAGRLHRLVGKDRDSLVTLSRLLAFALRPNPILTSKAVRAELKTLSRDVDSLREHALALLNTINFQLDAALGLIATEQNTIMKVFSIIAGIFLPPMLVAGIYGMNFERMPELGWPWGYPAALVVILASAVVPVWVLRRKGWL